MPRVIPQPGHGIPSATRIGQSVGPTAKTDVRTQEPTIRIVALAATMNTSVLGDHGAPKCIRLVGDGIVLLVLVSA